MTITFYDVSNYQGDYHPTGPTIEKATEGGTFTDARFATTKARTLAGGWPLEAYHYVTVTSSPQAQAQHAYNVIGPDIGCMWDIEKGGGNLAHLCAVHDAYVAVGGRPTLVYLPRWYWETIGSPSLQPLIDRGLGLVSSNYTAYSDTGPGWDPYGGMHPVIWQYTSTPLDTNAFKGTEDQLRAVFQGESMQWTDDVIPNPAARPDSPAHTPPGNNPTTQVTFALGDMWDKVYDTLSLGEANATALAALTKQVTALSAAVAKIPTTAAPANPADTAGISAQIASLRAALAAAEAAGAAALK